RDTVVSLATVRLSFPTCRVAGFAGLSLAGFSLRLGLVSLGQCKLILRAVHHAPEGLALCLRTGFRRVDALRSTVKDTCGSRDEYGPPQESFHSLSGRPCSLRYRRYECRCHGYDRSS